MKKRIFSIFLVLAFLLAGCGQENAGSSKSDDDEEEEEKQEQLLGKGYYEVYGEDDDLVGYLHVTGSRITVYDGRGREDEKLRYDYSAKKGLYSLDGGEMFGSGEFTVKKSKKKLTLITEDEEKYTLEEIGKDELPGGRGEEAPARTPEPEATPAAPAPSGIRVLNRSFLLEEGLEYAAAAYEAITGVPVEIEYYVIGEDLQTILELYDAAGDMPDIFINNSAADFANWSGRLADMSRQPWASDTEFAFVDDYGAVVGFPCSVEAIGLACNADVLARAGVDPSRLTSPAALREAFETIDAKKAELGLTAVVGYCAEPDVLNRSSGNLFGQYLDAGLDRHDTAYIDLLMDGGRYDKTRLIHFAEMVGLLNEYSDPDLLTYGFYEQQIMGFASGSYAFVPQGSWLGRQLTDFYSDVYEAAGSFECGFVPFAFEDGIDTVLANASAWWAVWGDGNVDEAMDFLNWLASPDGQRILVELGGCFSPFSTSPVLADDPFARTVFDYVVSGRTSAWHWLDMPKNLTMDYTGAIFYEYASGTLDTAGFVDALIEVTPRAFR